MIEVPGNMIYSVYVQSLLGHHPQRWGQWWRWKAINTMKKFAIVLALASLSGMVFGWWGLETIAGRRAFDEMAGIIPLVTGVASLILLVIAVALHYFAKS